PRARVAWRPRCAPAERICAGWRQPDDAVDVARGEPNAILDPGAAVGIVAASAGVAVQEPAAHIGEIGPGGIIGILQLNQAAAATAVAEAFPFGFRHLPQ